MTKQRSPALADEAQRYLALVDLFRAEGCEPQWRSEGALRRSAVTAAGGEPERRNE